MKNLLLEDLGFDETEFVRIPKDWKEKLDKLTSLKEQENFFFQALEFKKLDIKNYIESLEEDLLLFKAFGLKYKNELEKVYEEQFNQLEELFNNMNAQDHIYSKIKELKNYVNSVDSSVNEIERKIKYMSVSNLERAIEVVERFNRMSSQEKNILSQLLKEDFNG